MAWLKAGLERWAGDGEATPPVYDEVAAAPGRPPSLAAYNTGPPPAKAGGVWTGVEGPARELLDGKVGRQSLWQEGRGVPAWCMRPRRAPSHMAGAFDILSRCRWAMRFSIGEWGVSYCNPPKVSAPTLPICYPRPHVVV